MQNVLIFVIEALKNFPSYRICPYAKYEDLEISEIFLFLFFCYESVERSVETVAKKANN